MDDQKQSKRIVNRRDFLASVSASALGVATIGSAAALSGCTDVGSTPTLQQLLSFLSLVSGATSNTASDTSTARGVAPTGSAAMPTIGACTAAAGVNDGPRTIKFAVTTNGTQDLIISGQGLTDFYHVFNNGVEGTSTGATTQQVTLNVANNPPSNTFIVNVAGQNASGTSAPAKLSVNLNNMTCTVMNVV